MKPLSIYQGVGALYVMAAALSFMTVFLPGAFPLFFGLASMFAIAIYIAWLSEQPTGKK